MSQSLEQSLAGASQALQQGDPERARSILESLAATHQDHPDRLHLLGLVHKGAGDLERAEECLRASLERRPRQPAVLSNLGNLLKQAGRIEAAEQAYRQALDMEPGFADAGRNLGLLLASLGRDEEAVDVLEQEVRRRARDVSAWTTLGQCYRRLGDYDRSMAAFQRALAIHPRHVNAIAGLGQTLRMTGRPAEAAQCFDRALPMSREPVELLLARADVTADQGLYDEALARYRQVVERAPTHVLAHTQLSELLWQTGAAQRYGESFARALEMHPDSPELLAAWCRGLAGTGASDQALRQLQARPALVAEHPELLLEHGRCSAAAGQMEAATDSFRRALELSPDDPQINLEFAQFAIYRGDYPQALEALAVVERSVPEDQLLWACRGLCWRLMDDPRAEWLNDHSLLVGTYEIDCPPGYGNLDGFLAALAETLEGLHKTRAAPAHQSLRGGTQTAPRLFYRPDRVIQDLRQSLTRVLERYIHSLPEDPDHPMLRRRSRHFYFSGSWSVRLRSGGFHVNHVHPQGWISSSHYVVVPADIGTSSTQPAGWLKFGESWLGLGDRERISRLVKPEPGQVTLFPSYFWHGTVPFESREPRITTPFDVAPAR